MPAPLVPGMSDFPLASKARIAAVAGWATLAGILALEVVGPSLVAGERVSGTFDAATIRAYYGHAGLLPLEVLQYAVLPVALLFAYALRESLARDGKSRFLATAGLLFLAAEVPILLLHTGLSIVVTDLAARGGDVVPMFRLWDVTYNGGLYLFETGWVIAFSLAMRGAIGFPRWAPGFGVVTGAVQAFNAFALWLGVPDTATLPGNLLLIGWFGMTAVALGRMARAAGASPAAAAGARLVRVPAGKS